MVWNEVAELEPVEELRHAHTTQQQPKISPGALRAPIAPLIAHAPDSAVEEWGAWCNLEADVAMLWGIRSAETVEGK